MIQYSLSFLAAMLTIIAIAIGFRMELLGIASQYFHSLVVAIFAIAFFLAHRGRYRLSWGFALPLMVCALYACFAHYRITNGLLDLAWPRPFPYPDQLLNKMILWFGPSSESIAPNSLNIHGGYYESLYTVVGTSLVLSAMTGWTIGMAMPKRRAR